MDNEIEDIVFQISEIKNMQLEQLEITESQVYNIINNGIKNEKIIEHTFDKMLDLAYWLGNDIYKLYYSLLDYYEKINMEASKDYENFYLEIINEE